MKAPCRKPGVILAETFLDVRPVRAVFGTSAAYLDVEVSNPEFLDAAGVTHRLDAAACLKRLDQFRSGDRFVVRDVRYIYRELEKLFEEEASLIENAFAQEPRIYVPSRRAWFTSDSVVWEFGGEFMDRHCPSLETTYREHQTFFCRRLRITRHPSEATLISALPKLDEFGETPDDRRAEALKIYKRLARSLRDYQSAGGEGEPDWFAPLHTEQVFLDHLDRRAEVSNDMYIGDDPRLTEAFKVHEQISILAVDQWQLPQVMDLLQMAGMQKLSAVATYQLSTVESAEVDADTTRRIRQRSAQLMRLLYARAHSSFERASREGLWKALKTLEVRLVSTLEVEAEVNGHRVQVPMDTYRHEGHIYVQKSARAKLDKVAQELCLFFGARPDALADSVYRLLTAINEDELLDFFEVKGVPDIPGDELALLVKGEVEGQTSESEAAEVEPVLEEDEVPVEAGTQEADEAPSASTATASGASNAGSASGGASSATPTSTPRLPSVATPSSPSSSPSSSSSTTSSPPAPASSDSSTTSSGGSVRRREPERRRSGRLISYAESHKGSSSDQEPDGEAQQERLAIAKAAVEFVLETERQAGHDVVEMPFLNEGFDIRRTVGENEEYLEVKGLGGAWGAEGLVMTPPELRMAERERTRYWLYVVEYATDPTKRTLYKIPDPYGKVDQFRFDAGWKTLVGDRADSLEPSEGRRIVIEEVGAGTILSVSQMGMFHRLNIRLDSGEEVTKTFDPAKMTVQEA